MQVPSVGIDYLTNILKVGDVPLPVKINVISWLASSAVVMSRTNGHALHDTEDRKLIESAMDSISPIGSTTVRRPKRLLQLKSKTTLFRNSFHEVSDSMFYPLLSTLLASLNGKRRTERHLKFVPEQLTIDNIFRISSNEGIDQSSYKEEVSVGSPNVLASIEGIDALLPSQAMIALSTIAECCQNSLKAR